jgi:hypothetical protein
MPLLGFTKFHDEIRNGVKRQTIRRHPKKQIHVGDTLYLYWHPRKQDCRLIERVKCTESFTLIWGTIKQSEEIAKLDGFKSALEMREWFNKTYHLPDDKEMFDVIRW